MLDFSRVGKLIALHHVLQNMLAATPTEKNWWVNICQKSTAKLWQKQIKFGKFMVGKIKYPHEKLMDNGAIVDK